MMKMLLDHNADPNLVKKVFRIWVRKSQQNKRGQKGVK